MGFPNKETDKAAPFEEITSGIEVDYHQLLFRAMDRCALLAAMQSQNFPSSVESLEFMIPEKDDKYNEVLDKVRVSIKELRKRMRRRARIVNSGIIGKYDEQKINTEIHFYMARKKVNALIELAKRKGHLPMDEIEITL